MLNSFITNSVLSSLLFFCFLPEILLVLLVCFLILVAVSHHESRIKSYFSFSLNNFLVVVAYFFLFLGIYFTVVAELYFVDLNNLTVFTSYNTLKINITIIYIKLIISLLVAFSLYNAKRYLLLTNLVSYEYPLLVSLATLGMFLSISSNNWIVLFLSLELQALSFLVLFAWNRRNVKAITASLKFAIVNFIASLLILLAIVEILLYTQTFNMYLANPFFFLKQTYSYLAQDNLLSLNFIEWLQGQGNLMMQFYYNMNTAPLYDILQLSIANDITSQKYTTSIAELFASVVENSNIKYSLLWDFVSFLFVIGFSIKLGLVPFGLWLQDLYTSVSLPVLTFFATAPKITYVTILMSLYINLFAFVNPTRFLYMMGVLSVISIVVSNVAMFSIRNDLLRLLAWSSIANMSLLFFSFSQYPFQSYSFIFILYYTVGTLLFFVVLQYIVLEDSNDKTRHILYFSDLAVLRSHKLFIPLCLVVLVSLLNFFGIPPLMGFWMKLAVVQALVLSNLSFINWFLTVTLLLITLVGGYNYLRIFYVILSETNNPNVDIVNLPNTKTDFIPYVLWFIVSQIFFVGYYDALNSLFDSILLFTGNILVLPFGSDLLLAAGLGISSNNKDNSKKSNTKKPSLDLNFLSWDNEFLVVFLKYVERKDIVLNELVPNKNHPSTHLLFYLTLYESDLVKLEEQFSNLKGGMGYREFDNRCYYDYNPRYKAEVHTVKLFFIMDNSSLKLTQLGINYLATLKIVTPTSSLKIVTPTSSLKIVTPTKVIVKSSKPGILFEQWDLFSFSSSSHEVPFNSKKPKK
jgi:NADH:ubiquinone oxidoreductase subunit 2 (subunit N)